MMSPDCIVIVVAAVMVLFVPSIYPFFSDVDQVVGYSVRHAGIVEFTFLFAAIGIIARSVFQA